MVVAIHTSVKGRGRYKVKGLFRSEYAKTFLELRLPRHNGIKQASANMTTGNVLVTFNSDNTRESIQTLIQNVVREAEKKLPSAGESTKKSFDKEERGGGGTGLGMRGGFSAIPSGSPGPSVSRCRPSGPKKYRRRN